MKQAKDKVVKEVSEISKSEWAYYIGYGITFVIPTAAVASVLGKAGKVGKSFGKFLVWIEKAMNDAFGFVFEKGKSAFDNLIALFKKITEKFKEGAKGINQLIKKFFAALKEWIETITGKKTDDAFSKLFSGNKAIIQSLKDLGLTIAERDSYFEMFFEGKRLLAGAEDEIIKTCELLDKKYSGDVRKMLKQATDNGFGITDETLVRLKKQKQVITEVLENKKTLASNKESGNFAEMFVPYTLETNIIKIKDKQGFLKRVSSAVIDSLNHKGIKGIDGVYEFSSPPPKYLITEVKYNTATLNTTITKSGGSQMSKKWVTFDLFKGAVSAEIADDILIHGYEPLLCHVSKQGKLTIITIEQSSTGARKGITWVGKIQ